MTANVTERLTLEDNRIALALYGERNANLKLIERETGAELHTRGNDLTIVGPGDGVAPAGEIPIQQPIRHERSEVAQ